MTRSIRICGICDFPALMHTAFYRNDFVCNREALSFDVNEPRTYINDRGREVTDYDQLIIGNSLVDVLPPNVSGSEAMSGSDLMTKRLGSYVNGEYVDEADYVSPTVEWNKLDRWHDTTSRIGSNFEGQQVKSYLCTPTLEEHQSGKAEMQFSIKYTKIGVDTKIEEFLQDEPVESRNAYVEGQDGFTSIQLLNLQLTRKYHAKVLNVFKDKRTGKVKIGSIELTKNADGTTTAKCVNCKANITSPRFSDMHEEEAQYEMESFTWAVVAHGNNHAAKWFKDRPTYHKVHRLGCDISKCSESVPYCQHVNHEKPATDAEVVRFLMDHNSKCTDPKCECPDRLKELQPSLT